MSATYESMEKLGMLSDDIDNLLGAMELPMPAQFHLDRLKSALPNVRDGLREVYRLETGDDPWSTTS